MGKWKCISDTFRIYLHPVKRKIKTSDKIKLTDYCSSSADCVFCIFHSVQTNCGGLLEYVCIHIYLCKHCFVCSLCGMQHFLWANHPLQPQQTQTQIDLIYCILYAYIQIQFIVRTCLFASPCMGKWVCPSFCLRCWPGPQVCHDPNNIFPEPCFHRVSWAITVISIIIEIILTLVPLCFRKGLTLSAIYADWLDRPGIPKVWGLSFFFSSSNFFLSFSLFF